MAVHPVAVELSPHPGDGVDAAGPVVAAALEQPSAQLLVLSGSWTAAGLGPLPRRLDQVQLAPGKAQVDGSALSALDSVGAWLLHRLIARLHAGGAEIDLNAWPAPLARRLAVVDRTLAEAAAAPAASPAPGALVAPTAPGTVLQRLGSYTIAATEEARAMLAFVGETALAAATTLRQPNRLRGRPVLFNIRSAGLDALPIVGLLSFLLGVVVSYQGAAQLRLYGANIFVVDLIGVSMLREFAPLITAIIVAGRSGSAYAAQIGTMAVTEEIDALQTLGIVPQEMLVLPKVLALVIALPLLTVFADLLGVLGGMLMAKAQLDVGYIAFADRFVKAVDPGTLGVGLAKAPVFAAIIVVVGCFQGFRTRGGADSVGRQTTRSVVQAIFLVIVADALFSVAFSALGL